MVGVSFGTFLAREPSLKISGDWLGVPGLRGLGPPDRGAPFTDIQLLVGEGVQVETMLIWLSEGEGVTLPVLRSGLCWCIK